MKLGQKIAIGYIRASINLRALVSPRKAAKKAFAIFCTPHLKSKKKTPAIFKKGEKLQFKLDNLQIRGHRWNPGGSTRLLILHGFESASQNFDRYIQQFIKKNYEVLAFDAPAHGESEGKRIQLPQYIEMIRSIYIKYGPIHCFLAHSFGGLALVRFLASIPNDSQTKAVLVAPAVHTSTAIDSFFRFLGLNGEIREEFDRLILEKSGVPVENLSIPEALPRVNAQLLWVQDKQDDITPYHDMEPLRTQKIPHLRFLITDGLGHRRIYRDEKVVKAITEFL